MLIIAGPPGSGKSATFPVSAFGLDYFNADDHAAELNEGSYIGIRPETRKQVNQEFEAFILEHIRSGTSFAIETTLRSDITFDQARAAKKAGFRVEMRYLTLNTFLLHIQRVKTRAFRGGHSGPEPVLRAIYDASLNNLSRAIREMDSVLVYDNSSWGSRPVLLLETAHGAIVYQAEPLPKWLTSLGQP